MPAPILPLLLAAGAAAAAMAMSSKKSAAPAPAASPAPAPSIPAGGFPMTPGAPGTPGAPAPRVGSGDTDAMPDVMRGPIESAIQSGTNATALDALATQSDMQGYPVAAQRIRQRATNVRAMDAMSKGASPTPTAASFANPAAPTSPSFANPATTPPAAPPPASVISPPVAPITAPPGFPGAPAAFPPASTSAPATPLPALPTPPSGGGSGTLGGMSMPLPAAASAPLAQAPTLTLTAPPPIPAPTPAPVPMAMPTPAAITPVTPPPPAAPTAPLTWAYTIKSGDSPWAIAAHYTGKGQRWTEILPLNSNLRVVNGMVQPFNPNQVLQLPSSWLGSATS